jgi:hypothetical protein
MEAKIIKEILELHGEMPDSSAFSHYLRGLLPVQLLQRLQYLKQDEQRAKQLKIVFWSNPGNL